MPATNRDLPLTESSMTMRLLRPLMKTFIQSGLLLQTLLCVNIAQSTEFKVDPAGRHLLLKNQPFYLSR
jgi:hypothetical protein